MEKFDEQGRHVSSFKNESKPVSQSYSRIGSSSENSVLKYIQPTRCCREEKNTMRTTTMRAVLIKLIAVLGASFAALNIAYAGNVTAGPSWAAGSMVINGRPSGLINCDIRADGVPVAVPDTLKSFICTLKMLGATELGYMVLTGNQMINFSLTTSQTASGKVYSAHVFSGVFYLDVNGKPASLGSGGQPMTSPDQAVIAAVAVAGNRTVAMTYWGQMPLFNLAQGCSLQAGTYSGQSPTAVVSSITLL